MSVTSCTDSTQVFKLLSLMKCLKLESQYLMPFSKPKTHQTVMFNHQIHCIDMLFQVFTWFECSDLYLKVKVVNCHLEYIKNLTRKTPYSFIVMIIVDRGWCLSQHYKMLSKSCLHTIVETFSSFHKIMSIVTMCQVCQV